jgi:hypothetical protein
MIDFTMREFHMLQGWHRRLAFDGSLIVLLTFTDPFGTFVDLVTPLRLAYWTAAVGGCSILMHLVIGATLAAPLLSGSRAVRRKGFCARRTEG